MPEELNLTLQLLKNGWRIVILKLKNNIRLLLLHPVFSLFYSIVDVIINEAGDAQTTMKSDSKFFMAFFFAGSVFSFMVKKFTEKPIIKKTL